MNDARPSWTSPRAPRVAVWSAVTSNAELASAAFEAAGARPVDGAATPGALLAALSAGAVDHLVVLGALPEAVAQACAASAGLADRVTVRGPHDPAPPPAVAHVAPEAPLAELVSTVLGPGAPTGGEATLPLGEGGAVALLGAAASLRATARLTFSRGDDEIALCLSAGRVLAAGRSATPLGDAEPVRRDEGLSLLLTLWLTNAPTAPPGRCLEHEIDLVCEYGALFAGSATYRAHVVDTLADLVAFGAETVRVEGLELGAEGLPLEVGLFEALARAEGRHAVGLLPAGGRLFVPRGLPTALRGALPAQRFGRLFFALEAPHTLAEVLGLARLPEADVRAALALAYVTGELQVEGVHDANRSSGIAIRPAVTPRTGRRVRVQTRYDSTGQVLRQALCGDARRLVLALQRSSDAAKRAGQRPLLVGTRFEPVGEVRTGLVDFVRLARGPHTTVDLVAQRGHAGEARLSVMKRGYGALASEPEALEALLTLVRGALGLLHEGLVTVHQVLRDGSEIAVIMDHVHGLSLSEIVAAARREGEALPLDVLAWIGAQAATALHFALSQARVGGAVAAPCVRPDRVLISFDGEVRLTCFVPSGAEWPRAASDATETLALAELAALLREASRVGRDGEGAQARGLWRVLDGGGTGEAWTNGALLAQALRGTLEPGDSMRARTELLARRAAAEGLTHEVAALARIQRAADAIASGCEKEGEDEGTRSA